MKRVLFFVLFVFCFLRADDKIYLVPLYPDFEELEVVGYDYFSKIGEINKEKEENNKENHDENSFEKSPVKEIFMSIDEEKNLEEQILNTSIKEFDAQLRKDEENTKLLQSLNMDKVKEHKTPKNLDLLDYDEISVEVSTKANIMKIYAKSKSGNKLLKTFVVSTGKENIKKPFGIGKISAISLKPTWYPTQSTKESFAKKGIILPNVVPYGNKYNYMGAAKINLTHIVDGQSTYRIHGTLNEKTIGTNESAGCIRMKNNEVLELAILLQDFSNIKRMNKISVDLF